jgi:hypothetical protein
MQRKGSSIHYLWECKSLQLLYVWRVIKKLKTELLHYLAILLLIIYPKKMKFVYQKDTCTLRLLLKYRTHIHTHLWRLTTQSCKRRLEQWSLGAGKGKG